ncbi:MarR family winged helix-turn-helix transcriptional regulator [Demequina sp. NBRC 110052]|uniref:MarR family winged helix-turn-helix transcriptional regulator n=1 Tax=Demequina sp. NBRC 110052 TaxID=1570341 RepID=UPI0009FD1D37|nr:MarR family transcriptional regulator [Demequina sp. NBRC 110052]
MLKDLAYLLQETVTRMEHRVNTRLRSELGVSFNLFQFLAIVADEEPTDVTDLASCLYISKAAVSKRLPALTEEGWLTVSAEPGHGRRLRIQLTDKGRTLVADGDAIIERALTEAFGDSVSSDDVARMHALMTTVNARLIATEEPWL